MCMINNIRYYLYEFTSRVSIFEQGKEFFVTRENGLKAAFWIMVISCCCPWVSAPMALIAGIAYGTIMGNPWGKPRPLGVNGFCKPRWLGWGLG